jgi:hypothetical protein
VEVEGCEDFGGVSGSSWESLWCLELMGFEDCDGVLGGFAFEGVRRVLGGG